MNHRPTEETSADDSFRVILVFAWQRILNLSTEGSYLYRGNK